MRIVRNIAALVGIGTIGFAVGDFASHPNPLGALGLVALVGVVTFLLSHLFRSERTPAPAPKVDPPPRRQERAKPAEPVWSGWSGEEAEVARQQRRERRR